MKKDIIIDNYKVTSIKNIKFFNGEDCRPRSGSTNGVTIQDAIEFNLNDEKFVLIFGQYPYPFNRNLLYKIPKGKTVKKIIESESNIGLEGFENYRIIFNFKDDDFKRIIPYIAGNEFDYGSPKYKKRNSYYYNPIAISAPANHFDFCCYHLFYILKNENLDFYIDLLLKNSKFNYAVKSIIKRYGLNIAIKRKLIKNIWASLSIVKLDFPNKNYVEKSFLTLNNLYEKAPEMKKVLSMFTSVGSPIESENQFNKELCALSLALFSKEKNAFKGFYKKFKPLFKDEVVKILESKSYIGIEGIYNKKEFSFKNGILNLYFNDDECISLDLINNKVLKTNIEEELLYFFFTDELFQYNELETFNDRDQKNKLNLLDTILWFRYPFLEKLYKCELYNIYQATKNVFSHENNSFEPKISIEFYQDFIKNTESNNEPLQKIFGLTMEQLIIVNDMFSPIGGLTLESIVENTNNSSFSIYLTRISNDVNKSPIVFIEILKTISKNIFGLSVNSLDKETFKTFIKIIVAYSVMINNSERFDKITPRDYPLFSSFLKFKKVVKEFFVYTGTEDYGMKLWDNITILRDIFGISIYLKINLENFPAVNNYKEFLAFHDKLVGLYNAKKTEEKILREKDNQILLDKNKELLKKREQLEFSDEKYIIYAPTNLADLILEGQSLRHCVGTYTQAHATGDCTILFLRKANEPEKSFYTIELNDKFDSITQIHGFSNKNIDQDPDAIPTVKLWANKNNIQTKNVLK